jgi:hypothetical protein
VAAGEIEAAAARAAALGLRRVEVLAWAWAFPAGIDLSQGTGVEVVCLQLRRALLDPRGDAGEPPWSERPTVEVAFAVAATAAGRRVRARLVTARFSGPTRASAALQASRDPRAAIEAWSLALEAVDAGGAAVTATQSEALRAAGEVAVEATREAASGVAVTAAQGEAWEAVGEDAVEATREAASGGAVTATHSEAGEVAVDACGAARPVAGDVDSRGEAGQARVGDAAGVRLVWGEPVRGEAEVGATVPHRPVFAAARTRDRRELDGESGWVELVGAGPWTARVRVVDVLGGESWHAWRIEHVFGDILVRACV